MKTLTQGQRTTLASINDCIEITPCLAFTRDYDLGQGIDLEIFDTQDSLEERAQEWLAFISDVVADGVNRTKYTFNVPKFFIDWIKLTFDIELFDYLQVVKNSDLDASVFESALQVGVNYNDVDECYCGEFYDDAEFVEDYYTAFMGLDSYEMPPGLSVNHIDWDSVARDIMSDHVSHKGHYFRYM